MFCQPSTKFRTDFPQYILGAGGHALLRLVCFDDSIEVWTATTGDPGSGRVYPTHGYVVYAMLETLDEMSVYCQELWIDTDRKNRAYCSVNRRWRGDADETARSDALASFMEDLLRGMATFLCLPGYEARQVEGDDFDDLETVNDLIEVLRKNERIQIASSTWLGRDARLSFEDPMLIAA